MLVQDLRCQGEWVDLTGVENVIMGMLRQSSLGCLMVIPQGGSQGRLPLRRGGNWEV